MKKPHPDYDPAKSHHTPQGYRNNYPHGRPGGADFLRWQRERLLAPAVVHEVARIPVVAPDLAFLAQNRHELSATWIGHATVLLQVAGLNILTDPVFSARTSPVQFAGPKRMVPLPARLDELPPIDLVLISHNHYDHLDRGTVQALLKQRGGPPQFHVPLGMERWMAGQGIGNVQRYDWWQSRTVNAADGGIAIHYVPAQHWCKRQLLGGEHPSLWGGFVIEHGERKLWFAGDTGYSRDFLDIGARFGGFDFSMIPIGAYEPRWFMRNQHVNPDEAVQIHLDVKSKRSMGIHWGTFVLTDEPLHQPMDDLAAARHKHGVAEADFVYFAIGETRVIS